MSSFADVPWTNRAAERLGHHASTMLIASIVGAVVIGLYPLPGMLMFTAPIALFGFVLLSWLLMRQHDRKLCERCMSSMPLNAAEQAKKQHRRFWMAHQGSDPRFLVPYFAVLIGSNFNTTIYGRIGWALVNLSMVYLIMAQTTHRKLQPWCPQCSGDGGGEEVDTDAPPPFVPTTSVG